MSEAKKLKTLHCSFNRLLHLFVFNCAALTELYCGNNHLTSIDIRGNTKLEEFNHDKDCRIIRRGEKVSDNVLSRIAEFFSCKSSEFYSYVSDNALLQTLREEKEIRLSGGLYHEIQIRMTYNSNHI